MTATTRDHLVMTRIPLADLKHDPANPRLHDVRNLDAIKASLVEHGQVEPLIVQHGSYMVIGGNGRMDAMAALGWADADCVVLDIDDVKARRMSIALNRTSELAEWDMTVLARHLDELSDDDFDPDDLGFSDEEYMRLVAEFAAVPLGDADLPAGPGGDAEEASPGMAPGTQPGHLPSSHVRMIQLFLNESTEPEVRVWAKRLADEYGTDNLTDTIYQCLKRVARGRGWLDGADADGSTDADPA